mmetsp:Transcript_35678/g.114104  ORF Transcript_35678/g.114104 Transcript_35678/m.114104 type:complete len:237 (+) Transcript_35678:638-1348(+)
MSSKKVGILGGGQLGRMMLQVGYDYGAEYFVLDPNKEAPCASMCRNFRVGSLRDADAVFEFGKDLDVVTIEIEDVSVEGLKRLEEAGVRVVPKARDVELIQDKGSQKQFFDAENIPTAPFFFRGGRRLAEDVSRGAEAPPRRLRRSRSESPAVRRGRAIRRRPRVPSGRPGSHRKRSVGDRGADEDQGDASLSAGGVGLRSESERRVDNLRPGGDRRRRRAPVPRRRVPRRRGHGL